MRCSSDLRSAGFMLCVLGKPIAAMTCSPPMSGTPRRLGYILNQIRICLFLEGDTFAYSGSTPPGYYMPQHQVPPPCHLALIDMPRKVYRAIYTDTDNRASKLPSFGL